MVYRFKSHESVPEGIKRIARDEIDKALAQLTGQTDDDPEDGDFAGSRIRLRGRRGTHNRVGQGRGGGVIHPRPSLLHASRSVRAFTPAPS